LGVRHDTDGSLLPAVNAAPRALVFLTVPWSCPERAARIVFQSAAEQLAAEYPATGVECFKLDEDTDWCQDWLATLGVPQLGGGYPLGAGSILWLESGRAVSSEVSGCQLQPGGIVARTRWLWAKSAEPNIAADPRRSSWFGVPRPFSGGGC
jgi:hypothetical protein